jgi:hypothetical protein
MSGASPLHTDFWGILYDWQTIIAGFLALAAAAWGARTAYRIGNAQIAAVEQRDRLQAKALAAAVLPEILELRAHYERAMGVIRQDFLKINLRT